MDREIYQPAHFGFSHVGGNGFCKREGSESERGGPPTEEQTRRANEGSPHRKAREGAGRTWKRPEVDPRKEGSLMGGAGPCGQLPRQPFFLT